MRTYTIGEVLNRLKDEFDDITISKIRFLESEGLISPDRTEAGYRKFGDDDIDRLRYVLRAQRDRYLPLKVIKDELERIDAGLPVDDRPAAPEPAEVATVRPDVGSSPGPAAGTTPAPAAPKVAPSTDVATFLAGPATDVRLSMNELCDATGLESSQIIALRDHGLVTGEGTFDGDDLQVARAAAELMARGLEARHLRMFRQFADREQALYEQLVTPLLRQRNPESRASANEQLEELARHGDRLHRTVLGRELRAMLHS